MKRIAIHHTKKLSAAVLAGTMALGLAACGASEPAEVSSAPADSTSTASVAASTASTENAADFDVTQTITVVSREDGSGTRGAFIELTGVEEKNADGEKVDNTTLDATIANNTNNVTQTVAADETAIGYISMGSLNDTVKAVTVGGVAATAEAVKDGSYTLARPFNIVTMGEPTNETAADFIAFIMSAEGQAVVNDNGYIGDDAATAYAGSAPAGKVVVAGSSSVTPVMEKLIEAYQAVNAGAEIELQTSDSTTGVNAALEGSCDIGMASRELKDSEAEAGALATVIGMDGIAVVVNAANSTGDLSTEQIKSIYTGAITTWAEVQ